MTALDKKSLVCYDAIAKLYKETAEEPAELDGRDLTEDFTAMLIAMATAYSNLSGDEETDLIGFTHILNRLAVQCILEGKEESE